MMHTCMNACEYVNIINVANVQVNRVVKQHISDQLTILFGSDVGCYVEWISVLTINLDVS